MPQTPATPAVPAIQTAPLPTVTKEPPAKAVRIFVLADGSRTTEPPKKPGLEAPRPSTGELLDMVNAAKQTGAESGVVVPSVEAVPHGLKQNRRRDRAPSPARVIVLPKADVQRSEQEPERLPEIMAAPVAAPEPPPQSVHIDQGDLFAQSEIENKAFEARTELPTEQAIQAAPVESIEPSPGPHHIDVEAPQDVSTTLLDAAAPSVPPIIEVSSPIKAAETDFTDIVTRKPAAVPFEERGQVGIRRNARSKLTAAQELLHLLLTSDADSKKESDFKDQVQELATAAGREGLHGLFDAKYWARAFRDGGYRVNQLMRGINTVSLVGLMVISNDIAALQAIGTRNVDLTAPAAKVQRTVTTPALDAISLALRRDGHELFRWIDKRHVTNEFSSDLHVCQALSQSMKQALKDWATDDNGVTETRLFMIVVALKMGAMLDAQGLALLGEHTGLTDKRDELPVVFARLAPIIEPDDPLGLAALQIIISAARTGYDVMPGPGTDSPLTPYMTNDRIEAVQTLMAAGLDPAMPDENGVSPREHGMRAGARQTVAAADLVIKQRQLDGMLSSARALESIDELIPS